MGSRGSSPPGQSPRRSPALRPPPRRATPAPATAPSDTGLAFPFAQGYPEEKDSGRFRDDGAFWTLINDSLDARFSKRKRIARDLVAFHQARGDTIVFVTSRFPSEPASDRTSRLLQRLFAFPTPPKVLFTAQAPKTEAIRTVRSPVSHNERPVQPGKYGEEILANSAD